MISLTKFIMHIILFVQIYFQHLQAYQINIIYNFQIITQNFYFDLLLLFEKAIQVFIMPNLKVVDLTAEV